MWNSKYRPHWSAGSSGPKKDILGGFAMTARQPGLNFGVSEHLSNSFCRSGTAHGSDKTGSLVGVPYDGTDPQFSEFYHDYSAMPKDFVDKVVNATAEGRLR
jgi:alpha-L-fucosidase